MAQSDQTGSGPVPAFRKGMDEAANDIFTAEASYWGALLTFNAIVLAVFSAGVFTDVSNGWLSFPLIIAALICSVLLVLDFRSRLNWHYRKASLFLVERSQVDDALSVLSKDAASVRTSIQRRDRWILALLTLEVASIISIIALRALRP